jgi:hypothetical protein
MQPLSAEITCLAAAVPSLGNWRAQSERRLASRAERGGEGDQADLRRTGPVACTMPG